MRFRDYIKDHALIITVYAASLIVIEIFLKAFGTNVQAMGVVAAVFILMAFIVHIYDFRRRKRFYDVLETSVKELDKKYLLPEVLDEARFLDGRILSDTLQDCGKSMTENVTSEKRKTQNFREYIELWVHEIKLPVSALNLMCHNNKEIDPKMKVQLKRIDDYIDNVLYYARSENAEKDYIIKETPLNRAFSAAAGKNREELQLLNATINVSDLDVSVMTDGKWLEFIIGQLLDNTIKYRDDEKALEIRVSTKKENGKTEFIYEDNGTGISREDLPRIFEKSFTGSNGRETQKSTGMGLYIVKNLCDRLGHNIKAESEKGKYTRFTITFADNDYYCR